jgi:hypothetical protein
MRTKKRPAGLTAEALKEIVSQHSFNADPPSPQYLRVAFLARRHRLAPSLARVVAELAFINGGTQ